MARCFKRSFLKFAYDSAELSALKLLKTPVLSSFVDLYYLKVEAAPSIPSEISATWASKAWSSSLCSPAANNFPSHVEIWSMYYERACLESESLSMLSIQWFWSLTNYSEAAIWAFILPHCSSTDTSASSASASAYSA